MKEGIVLAVCKGNVQRSSTCSAVLAYEAEAQSLTGLVFDSQGLSVERIFSGRPSHHSIGRILNSALYYGVVEEQHRETVSGLLDRLTPDTNDTDLLGQLTAFYNKYVMITLGILVGFRNAALHELGIPEHYSRGMPIMYDPANVAGVVLTMTPSITDQVKAIHGEGSTKKILCYGDLVGQPPLEDNLTGGLPEARRQASYFWETRKTAIQRILEL